MRSLTNREDDWRGGGSKPGDLTNREDDWERDAGILGSHMCHPPPVRSKYTSALCQLHLALRTLYFVLCTLYFVLVDFVCGPKGSLEGFCVLENPLRLKDHAFGGNP